MTGMPSISPLKLALTGVYLLAWPALLMWLSNDWRWIEGWIFGVWFVALCATCTIWLYRKDPALLAERYRRPGTGGQSRSDRLIVYGIMVGFVIWIVVPPLDVRRFGWTPQLPRWLEPGGAALLLASAYFLFRSFADNPFLSPLVRIQEERGQRVVSTGVYRFVRHPMYLGAVLMFVGAPLLFRSTFGLAVGVVLSLLLAVRIVLEEKLLAQALEGYEEYRRKVRYRMLPFLW